MKGRMRALVVAVGGVAALVALALASAQARTGASTTAPAAAKQAKPHRHHHHRRCPHRRHRHHRRHRLRHGLKPTPARCRANPIPARVRSHRGKPVEGGVTAGPYPPPAEPPPAGDDEEERKLHIPAGPFVPEPKHATKPVPADGEAAALDLSPQSPLAGIGDIDVVRNQSLIASPSIASNFAATDGGEQSVATAGKTVLYTTNNGDALSTDGGLTFKYLDPRTIFPSAAGGFCCDQVVAWMPRVKRFVWVIQYWAGSGGVRNDRLGDVVRVATATPAQIAASGGRSWSYWDFTPPDFGIRRSSFRGATFPRLDRVHLATTRNWLYLTVDAWRARGKVFDGSVMWRIRQTQLKSGSIGFQYLHTPKASSKVRPAQDASAATATNQYFAGAATTSRLNVFKWSDAASAPIYEYDIDHGTVATEDTASNDPSSANWMDRYGKQAGAVVTGANTGNSLLFGWMFGRKAKVIRDGTEQTIDSHGQPGIGFIVINSAQNPPKKVAGAQIEYADLAAALPQLRANTDGSTALSFMLGGPSRYPSHAVGFLIGYAAQQTVSGQRSLLEPDSGGDYLGLANIPGSQCFAAAGSASKKGATDFIDPHYVIFGRAGAHCTPPTPPPDLVVDSIDGGFGVITIRVRNAGTGEAGASKLAYNTGTGDTLADVGALAPGQSATVYAPCPANGPVTVNARADATGVLAESDETNNAATAGVTCQLTQADLTVTSVYFNGDAGWKIFAVVANVGSDAAPATQTQVAQSGQPVVNVATPALASGATTTISVDCQYGSTASATVTADIGNAVAESNEANNSASGSGGTGGTCRYP